MATGRQAIVGAGPVQRAAEVAQGTFYVLRLYVANRSSPSIRARDNLRRLCEEHLAGRCRYDVVDLLQHPHLAKEDGIVAVPTLIRRQPGLVRKVVGDLSDTDRVLSGLDLCSPARQQCDAAPFSGAR